ncbi:MAG: hypothetical protein KAZ36_00365 [Bacteroidales bacterium]|nr:hypothetical protein [Bacteroidales bacterium]
MEENGKATPEQIAIWKHNYGDVYEVNVEDKYCYLKKPDRKTLSFAATVGETDPMKFNEIVLNNCWISGDETIKTNDELFFAVVAKLNALIEVKSAEIKKL